MAALSTVMRCSFLQDAVILMLFVCTISLQAKEFPALDSIRTKTSPANQTLAVEGLISRLIPTRASEFNVSVDPSLGPANKDTFKILSSAGRVTIVGTSGVAVAWGFQHYLKYYCGAHISWGGDQLRTIPSPLPDLPVGGITVTSNDRFRYYQNVCTVSYSFVWWNWTRWEREIDWMALNGINLPLAFTGQEAIFQRVYRKLGFTDSELGEFFTGPAFLAWGRMGNIEGFGGPLPQSWIDQKLALQHQILNRIRSLGMTPVLPGFAGHVPPATSRIFPNSTVVRLGNWAGFNATFSDTYLLDFNDPLFKEIGTLLILEMDAEFGTDHVYNADTFNEMVPKSSKPDYLASAGRAVYSAMATADPKAVWLMQGWMFLSAFWQAPQIKALLTSVEQGKILLLDLMSEHQPQYIRTDSYYGQPFIWCMLHNFGGNVEMYGPMPVVNTGPFTGRTFPNSSMVGTGLTPEGINQNDVMYEFMNENAWRTAPRNITQWVMEYSMRRYGGQNAAMGKAWELLARSLYNYTLGMRYHGRMGIVLRPSLSLKKPIWYQPADVISAWSNFLSAASQFTDSDLYRYDLVDVTRQSLQLVSVKYYADLINAYNDKNYTDLSAASDRFLGLLSDLDLILGSDPHFLLGRWLENAKAQATNDQERILYEYNARNQITLWGPSGEILDYGCKEWSGLVSGYYQKRWTLFVNQLKMAVKYLTQLLVLAVLTIAMIHPEVLRQASEPTIDNISTEAPLVQDDNLYCRFRLQSFFEKRMITKEDICVTQLLTVCMFIITLLLVYGAAKGRPGYLMPFFCIQVFDFCLACLAAVGYFSYMPNVKAWITCQLPHDFPLRDHFLSMDGEWLMLLVCIFFVLVLSLKAYLVGVVWSCYRFLHIAQSSCNNVRQFTVDPDTEMLLPPKYEDVIQMTNEQAPPPPYAPN